MTARGSSCSSTTVATPPARAAGRHARSSAARRKQRELLIGRRFLATLIVGARSLLDTAAAIAITRVWPVEVTPVVVPAPSVVTVPPAPGASPPPQPTGQGRPAVEVSIYLETVTFG